VTATWPELRTAAFARAEVGLLENPRAQRSPSPDFRGVLDPSGSAAARREISAWPGYAPTPLRRLDSLAERMGVSRLCYKDEGSRFGLGSFKALGGAYGVLRVVQEEVFRQNGSRPSAQQLMAGYYREAVSGITVSCATDGNHGRSVAWGAQLFGCRSLVYLHSGVSDQRERAIARFGAEVIRVAGDYDESVRRAQRDAEENGHLLVADTSYPGYERVPREVMHGYTVMVAEVVERFQGCQLPTHVFVQGGVGGLAAAVCAQLRESWGPDGPSLVVVEPERAACLYRSARQGRLSSADGDLDTIMAGLACGRPSLLAWRILEGGADYFMTIPDEVIAPSMLLLARGYGDEPAIVAGESGVAGMAAFIVAAMREELRRGLGLDLASRVLVFGTEGATDPDVYRRLIQAAELALPAPRVAD
jgi:diaminopropionate ammonia-lyase